MPAKSNPERPPRDLVDDVVAANRILARLNVLDAFGHVSVRDPRDLHRYLISRSIAPESVTAADILLLDLDSQIIDPKDDGWPKPCGWRVLMRAVTLSFPAKAGNPVITKRHFCARNDKQVLEITGSSAGACHRAGHFGPDPLADDDT